MRFHTELVSLEGNYRYRVFEKHFEIIAGVRACIVGRNRS